MKARINGSWTGWYGNTIVKLTNGSVWEQAEYYYEYRYSYRPEVRHHRQQHAGRWLAVTAKAARARDHQVA